MHVYAGGRGVGLHACVCVCILVSACLYAGVLEKPCSHCFPNVFTHIPKCNCLLYVHVKL